MTIITLYVLLIYVIWVSKLSWYNILEVPVKRPFFPIFSILNFETLSVNSPTATFKGSFLTRFHLHTKNCRNLLHNVRHRTKYSRKFRLNLFYNVRYIFYSIRDHSCNARNGSHNVRNCSRRFRYLAHKARNRSGFARNRTHFVQCS